MTEKDILMLIHQLANDAREGMRKEGKPETTLDDVLRHLANAAAVRVNEIAAEQEG